jgi:hypothetical protein
MAAAPGQRQDVIDLGRGSPAHPAVALLGQDARADRGPCPSVQTCPSGGASAPAAGALARVLGAEAALTHLVRAGRMPAAIAQPLRHPAPRWFLAQVSTGRRRWIRVGEERPRHAIEHVGGEHEGTTLPDHRIHRGTDSARHHRRGSAEGSPLGLPRFGPRSDHDQLQADQVSAPRPSRQPQQPLSTGHSWRATSSRASAASASTPFRRGDLTRPTSPRRLGDSSGRPDSPESRSTASGIPAPPSPSRPAWTCSTSLSFSGTPPPRSPSRCTSTSAQSASSGLWTASRMPSETEWAHNGHTRGPGDPNGFPRPLHLRW